MFFSRKSNNKKLSNIIIFLLINLYKYWRKLKNYLFYLLFLLFYISYKIYKTIFYTLINLFWYMNKQLLNNKYFTQKKIMNTKTHSNFGFNSNKDIMLSLWKSFALTRINKWMRQEDIVEMTGVSISTIRRFEAWNVIAFDSFLKLIRSVWKITDIDALLNINNQSNNFDYDRVRG